MSFRQPTTEASVGAIIVYKTVPYIGSDVRGL